MSDREYQGWTNYETWCVNLWISNDEHTQREHQALARECVQDARESDETFTRLQRARLIMADRMKEQFEECVCEHTTSGLFADLLQASLDEVNWGEIAAHCIDESLVAEVEAEEGEDSE
jgi:hypothetical protein